ncbi:MAG TPA: c-type cytochrome [Chitinophagaceae bacterium]
MKRIFPLLLFISFLSFACKTKKDNTDVVPVLSVEESIKDLQIEDGFVVEVVCAEPLVEDPVALSFDEDANMWVVEMRGYMHDKEGGGEDQPLGRIKIVRDVNEDGQYDSSYVFLDSLILPRTVAIVNGGVLLIEPPGLFFIENNNGKAGKRTVIDSAFAETGNVEHQPNGLLKGIDNWHYCTSSDKRVKNIKGKWVVERTRSRGQWGLTMDDEGRLLYNNNSVMLMADNFLPGSFPVNPNHRAISGIISGVHIADNRVYPRRATGGVNRGYQKDVLDKEGKLVNVTSACGPVVYRGDNFPKEYYGNAFVMEPAAFLMKRILLSNDNNGLLQGKFAYDNREFLAATDERFRPVSAHNSPDGCLYFVDMHRGIIQHTTYMTPYLRRHIDSLKLDRPIGMGRIYRIRWKDKAASKPMKLSNYTTQQLLELLKHPNGYYREMAQRLLVERNDPSASDHLLKLITDKSDPKAALQSLWILDEMIMLNPALLKIVSAAHNGNLSIYQSCLQLLGESNEKDIAFEIYRTIRKKSDRIAEVCFLNGLKAFQDKDPDKTFSIAMEILSLFKNDPLITDAFMGSIATNEKKVLEELTGTDDTVIVKALYAAIKRSEQPKEDVAIAHLSRSEKDRYFGGKSIYLSYCSTCHGKEGDGIANIAPPLAGSDLLIGDTETPIKILLDGLTGPVTVNGVSYSFSNAMPGLRNNIETNNGEIAAVLTYVRNAFGNKAPATTVDQVGKTRAATGGRKTPYTISELK